MDDYSASMKEVANYIGRKFNYGAYIQRSMCYLCGPETLFLPIFPL